MGSISEVTPATRVNGRTRATRLHVTRGGLTTLAFLLPMLVIFGLFAWFPIVRAFVMSVQDTNLVSDPVFVGLQNFQRVLADRQPVPHLALLIACRGTDAKRFVARRPRSKRFYQSGPYHYFG